MQPARLRSKSLRIQVLSNRRSEGNDIVLDFGLNLSDPRDRKVRLMSQ